MTTVTIFQAGANAIATGADLFEVVEAAQAEGFDVNYDEIEITHNGRGLVDGQIYYTHDYAEIFGEQ